ncbi:MAG TPA: pyruvate kinase [Anaerolineaceae bacterium]
MRRAKVVATIGPSSQDEKILRKLITSGLDVARLNFSHGTYEDHAEKIFLIRKLSTELKKAVTILQDLQGPKLRIGTLESPLVLRAGQKVILSSKDNPPPMTKSSNNAIFIPMDVPDLEQCVDVGHQILMDDGNLELRITRVSSDEVETEVILGGKLSSHKGVNLPGARLTIPGFTEKDEADLKFGLDNQVDVVAISFVRNAEDVLKVKKRIQAYKPDKADLPVIAKIELPDAIANLDEIIEAADGVMVARGDLGVEMSPSRVPSLQKRIIQKANAARKSVITATQMLESMIHNPRPTRAEASDVANAIYDGTDAVMLSGETASGEYPVESLTMMVSIIEEAEMHYCEWGSLTHIKGESNRNDAVSITHAASELARDRDVAAIAVFTLTGKTAQYLAKSRPSVPILAFTPSIDTMRRMGLLWGTTPYLVPYATNVETMVKYVDAAILSSTSIGVGEQVVVVTGFPVGDHRQPNLALLHTIGESIQFGL